VIQNQKCPECKGVSYGFQEALKFLELENQSTLKTESQIRERKLLDECFIADCKNVVERCT